MATRKVVRFPRTEDDDLDVYANQEADWVYYLLPVGADVYLIEYTPERRFQRFEGPLEKLTKDCGVVLPDPNPHPEDGAPAWDSAFSLGFLVPGAYYDKEIPYSAGIPADGQTIGLISSVTLPGWLTLVQRLNDPPALRGTPPSGTGDTPVTLRLHHRENGKTTDKSFTIPAQSADVYATIQVAGDRKAIIRVGAAGQTAPVISMDGPAGFTDRSVYNALPSNPPDIVQNKSLFWNLTYAALTFNGGYLVTIRYQGVTLYGQFKFSGSEIEQLMTLTTTPPEHGSITAHQLDGDRLASQKKLTAFATSARKTEHRITSTNGYNSGWQPGEVFETLDAPYERYRYVGSDVLANGDYTGSVRDFFDNSITFAPITFTVSGSVAPEGDTILVEDQDNGPSVVMDGAAYRFDEHRQEVDPTEGPRVLALDFRWIRDGAGDDPDNKLEIYAKISQGANWYATRDLQGNTAGIDLGTVVTLSNDPNGYTHKYTEYNRTGNVGTYTVIPTLGATFYNDGRGVITITVPDATTSRANGYTAPAFVPPATGNYYAKITNTGQSVSGWAVNAVRYYKYANQTCAEAETSFTALSESQKVASTQTAVPAPASGKTYVVRSCVVFTGAVQTTGSDNPAMFQAEVYDIADGTYRIRNKINYSAPGGKTIKWIPNDSGFINASEIANRRFSQGIPQKFELWAVNEGAGLDGYRLNNPDHAQQILTVQ